MACADYKQNLIIREIKKRRGSLSKLIRYYECNCLNKECNNVTKIDVYSFRKWSGLCKKCSDLKKLTSIDREKNTTAKRPYEALYNNLVKQSHRRKIDMSLLFEEFVEFTKQTKCHYCNAEVFWSKVNLSQNGFRTNMDRKDNSLGYEKNNLVVCCWRCNNGRSNLFSYEEWFGMTEFLRKKG
jgi:hypothetical protein